MIKGIDTAAAADEIVKVLAKHEIPVSLIDALFATAKNIACNNSYVRNPTSGQVEKE